MKFNNVIVNSVLLLCCSHTACLAEPEAVVSPHAAASRAEVNQVKTVSVPTAGINQATKAMPAAGINPLTFESRNLRVHKIGIPGLFHIDFGSAE